MARTPARLLNGACALQLLRVRTLDGRFLGHVFDLRTHWRPGQTERPVIECLVVGRRGWLERVGLGHGPDTVPWSAVRRIEQATVWVDPQALK